jgi:hypothetical protein
MHDAWAVGLGGVAWGGCVIGVEEILLVSRKLSLSLPLLVRRGLALVNIRSTQVLTRHSVSLRISYHFPKYADVTVIDSFMLFICEVVEVALTGGSYT